MKAKTCEFVSLADSIIRDQIVYSISNKKLRQRLLREQDVLLTKAVDMCKANEIAEKQNKAWDKPEFTFSVFTRQLKDVRRCQWKHHLNETAVRSVTSLTKEQAVQQQEKNAGDAIAKVILRLAVRSNE